jgi:hypothetical protein
MTFENDFVNRSVTFSQEARDDVKRLDKSIPRLQSILTSIQIFLGCSAHKGKPLYKPCYLYVTRKQPDAPALEVYYGFDSKTVTVYNIYIADQGD